MRLLRRAVGSINHGRLLHNLRRYAQWAATMQDRLFVTVATASPMSEAQVSRLRGIREKRYGVTVDMAISVDPTLIGGAFRLRAGMTAIDARSPPGSAKRGTRLPAMVPRTDTIHLSIS